MDYACVCVCNLGIYGYVPKQVEMFFGTKVTMEDIHFVLHGVHGKGDLPFRWAFDFENFWQCCHFDVHS